MSSSAAALFACSKCNSRHPFEDLSQGQQLCKVSAGDNLYVRRSCATFVQSGVETLDRPSMSSAGSGGNFCETRGKPEPPPIFSSVISNAVSMMFMCEDRSSEFFFSETSVETRVPVGGFDCGSPTGCVARTQTENVLSRASRWETSPARRNFPGARWRMESDFSFEISSGFTETVGRSEGTIRNLLETSSEFERFATKSLIRFLALKSHLELSDTRGTEIDSERIAAVVVGVCLHIFESDLDLEDAEGW